jgi:hypothetical protein
MKQDRFLVIILAGIGLLVLSAILIFVIRRNSQTYSMEDTPEGVLRNYILAINREDYAKAFGYLPIHENQPDSDKFQQHMRGKKELIRTTALKIISVDISGDKAEIEVVVTREGSDPFFDNRYSSNQTVLLELHNGAWKLTRIPYPFGY